MRYIVVNILAVIFFASCNRQGPQKQVYLISSSINDESAVAQHLINQGYAIKTLSIDIEGEQHFEEEESDRISDIIEAYEISELLAINSDHLSDGMLTNVTQRHFTDIESLNLVLSKLITQSENIIILDSWNLDREKAMSNNTQTPIFEDEMLYELAHDKFWKFVDAQNLIANEQNKAIVSSLIQNALDLFIERGAQIEIQNKSQASPISLSPRAYFERLANLDRYEGIELTWDQNLSVVSPWQDISTELPKKIAKIKGNQRFTGYKKSTILYSDQIEKQVELHAEMVESIDLTGKKNIEWQVLLGSIRTSSTPQSVNT